VSIRSVRSVNLAGCGISARNNIRIFEKQLLTNHCQSHVQCSPSLVFCLRYDASMVFLIARGVNVSDILTPVIVTREIS